MENDSRYEDFIRYSTEGIFLLEYIPPIPINLPPEEQYRLSVERGVITECNDAIAKMYGYSSREEMLGTRYLDLYQDEGIEKNLEVNIKFIQEGYRLTDLETEEFNSKGEKIYFLNNAVGIIEDEYFTKTWGTQRDITSLKQAEQKLIESYDITLKSLAKALELRDQETQDHSERVQNVTLNLTQALNIPEEEITHILRGAVLHDIGKMGIPDSVLLKPGELSSEEREIIKQHPQHSFDILSQIPFLENAIDIPYCHHERWDGKGYPRGLKGEEIPLAARIFSVVDVWDAICSDRPYSKAWPIEKAIQYLKDESGKFFDPHVVETFLSLVEQGKI